MNTNKIIIGTHNGIFHQDDVVAVALLSILHGNNITVKRTRDVNILSTCDYVVDVGGGELDHHLPGGNGVRENNIPYASAGLVWKKYSYDILKAFDCPDKLIYEVAKKVDKNIIEDVDKIDNGRLATSVFDFILLYIPNWNEDFSKIDNHFNKILTLTVKILSMAIKKEIANTASDNLIIDLLNNHPHRSHILEIPNQYIDWKPQIIEHNTFPLTSIDFVVFPYPIGGYAAQSVPPSHDKPFEQRIPFPREWAGLTTTLPEVSGIKTATFCHNNLFFVRAETKEDVYKLCEIAIYKFYNN